ncbi:MAG: flagellar hook-length control protein FliK [Gammaproteobacteria bacterium]|nr:flagellar hook-length control protein FliK [Gammaproteobacteria bacterium]
MEINPLLQAIAKVTLATSTTIPPEIRNWQTGQLLEAIATSQTLNGQVKLQVESTQFEARVQFPVEAGQKLVLEVIKQADPPILQLAQTDTNKNTIVNAALRAVLPKQVLGISPLLSNISFLSSQPAQQYSSLPPEVLVLARTFFNLLPDARNVSTPDGLRQAINNSGIFLENKLTAKHSGSNDKGIQQDLKAGLLKLQQAIETLSHNQTPSKISPTQTSNPKSAIPVTDRLVPNMPDNSKSPTNKSVINYAKTGNLITNRPFINASVTNNRGELSASDKINISNHLVNKLVSGNTLAGKPGALNPVTGKSVSDRLPENRFQLNTSVINKTSFARTDSYKAFSFTPVISNKFSNILLANRLLLNKSVIEHLISRNQRDGKILEQTITNTGKKTSADKQQASQSPDTRTNIQKALEIARNISDQVRDTAKTIRNTLGTPQRTAPGNVPAAGTSNIPGISAFFNTQGTARNSQPGHEELLKALSSAEDLNYLQAKKGIPVAQSRAQATVNQMSSIDHLITTLLRDVESSLARVQFHQLSTQQPQDTDTKQAWAMELPVRKEDGADIFHLHIERDDQQHTDTEPENRFAWTIRLSFTLEGLGPVHARISLSGDRISTIFWLEEKHTTALFQKHMDELQENLTRAGINIEKLNCLNGSPPESEKYFFPQQLLHEKA